MKLGLAGSAEYDSNIYRTSVDEKGDAVFRIVPKVSFFEDEGKFLWDVNYRAPWEKAINADRVDGFSHLLDAGAGYQVNGQTRLFFSDVFRYSDSINRFTTVNDADETPTVGTFREPVIRNSATLGVQHYFTPRLAGNFAFSNRLFETDLPSRADNMVYVGNTNLQYSLNTQHRVGGGAAFTYQDFEATNDGRSPATQTFFFNMYGSWTWALDETTSFSFTGGPTYVDTQYDSPPAIISEARLVPYFENPVTGELTVNDWTLCPPDASTGDPVIPDDGSCPGSVRLRPWVPAEETDINNIKANNTAATLASLSDPANGSNTWTFFAEISLNKRWTPRLDSSLTYSRTDSTASGTGSATLDLVSFVTTWRLSELWTFQVRGDFTHRESVTPSQENLVTVDDGTTQLNDYGTAPIALVSDPAFPLAHAAAFTTRTVKNGLDTDRWGVGMRMERRLTKHIRASLRYLYNQQSSRWRTAGSSSDFSNHLVTLGVQYDFDPWHLW